MNSLCIKHFPDEQTSLKVNREYTGEISYERYKANPQRIKCQMTARVEVLTKFIKWVSKTKETEVCKYNTSENKRCLLYVAQLKKTSIQELRELRRTLKMSSPQHLLTKFQFVKMKNIVGIKKVKR